MTTWKTKKNVELHRMQRNALAHGRNVFICRIEGDTIQRT